MMELKANLSNLFNIIQYYSSFITIINSHSKIEMLIIIVVIVIAIITKFIQYFSLYFMSFIY